MIKMIKIINANLITQHRIIPNSEIVTESGKILFAGETGENGVFSDTCEVIDVKGKYVSAGFIDMHVHGGAGYDFMDGTIEAFLKPAEIHAEHGTTSLVATTLASSDENLKNCLEVFEEAKKLNKNGAELLGLHLEGPYFAVSQKGAQNEKYIKAPTPDNYNKIYGWSDHIMRWSAAPELPGGIEFGHFLRSHNILASIAHSDAVYDEVAEAFEAGYTHVTHLYSAMSTVKRINAYRHAGVVESAFLIDGLTVEIIADGCHLPSSLLKLVYKIKGSENIALVTDAARPTGLPEGEYVLGSKEEGQRIIVEGGVAKLPDRQAFAGSIATTDRLVRTMINSAEVPLVPAVKMVTATPARILGIDKRKGSLRQGMDADLVVFDKNITIELSMVGGNIVYQNKNKVGGD